MLILYVFSDLGTLLLTVDVVGESVPNHKCSWPVTSIETESNLEMSRPLFDIAVASSILQKFSSVMDWKLTRENPHCSFPLDSLRNIAQEQHMSLVPHLLAYISAIKDLLVGAGVCFSPLKELCALTC